MSKVESSRVAPTDLELMQFFDGELAEPRRSEVRAFVEGNATARGKVAGLGAVGGAVRARAEVTADALGDLDVASLVIARASAEEAAAAPASQAAPSPRKRLELPAAAPKPANENTGRIFLLAGLAAVAAGALLWWGRSGPSETTQLATHAGSATPVVVDSAVEVASADDRTAPVVPDVEPPSADPTGVEVASVDFGRRSGAIFHVPTDVRGATTTVLWLSDE